MKLYRPKVWIEFYVDPVPRALHVVRCVDGEECNCDDAADAIDLLDKETKKYLRIMRVMSMLPGQADT